jgi:hypothetical protein
MVKHRDKFVLTCCSTLLPHCTEGCIFVSSIPPSVKYCWEWKHQNNLKRQLRWMKAKTHSSPSSSGGTPVPKGGQWVNTRRHPRASQQPRNLLEVNLLQYGVSTFTTPTDSWKWIFTLHYSTSFLLNISVRFFIWNRRHFSIFYTILVLQIFCLHTDSVFMLVLSRKQKKSVMKKLNHCSILLKEAGKERCTTSQLVPPKGKLFLCLTN